MSATVGLVTAVEEVRLSTTIEALDLDWIADRLVHKRDWDVIRVMAAIQGYRVFLQAIHDDPPGTIHHPPKNADGNGSDVDEVWHEHILSTQQYNTDCFRIVGRFIHHHPNRSGCKQACEGGCGDHE